MATNDSIGFIRNRHKPGDWVRATAYFPEHSLFQNFNCLREYATIDAKSMCLIIAYAEHTPFRRYFILANGKVGWVSFTALERFD